MTETPGEARAEKSADTPGTEFLVQAWARVKEHKVLQWTLAYLGAALALAHGAELLTQAFEWPHIISRILVALLVLGLPITVTVAWYHGHKGAHRVSGAELTIIALLLFIGAGLFFVLVQPKGEHAEAPAPQAPPQIAVAPAPRVPAETAAAPAEAPAPAPIRLPTATGKPRVAILPFENLSPDPANAFFTDGMHEEILSTLANAAPGLDVISRTTMMSYRGQRYTVEQVAKDLGVTHVLEGSVRREGNHVRLTLQLIDAGSDGHIWSQSYDRQLVSAMTLQSEVAQEVASQLSVQLAPHAQSSGPPTNDAEAYDLYLKARLALGQLVAVQPIAPYRDVEALLTKAIARDPAFMLAYVERFSLHLLFFLLNYDPSKERLNLAGTDLAVARRLAPNHPSVIAAEAQYAAFAERDFERAFSLFAEAEKRGLADPNLLQREASILNMVGRHEEAVALYARLVPLDPGNAFLLLTWVLDLVAAHRPAEAMHVIDLAVPHLPEDFRRRIDATRVFLRFWFTGSSGTDPADLMRIYPTVSEADLNFAPYWRSRHLYSETIQRLDQTDVDSIRVALIGNLPGFAIGRMPTADLRGWTNLLLGNDAAAARDGIAVKAFVEKQEEAPWNSWYLRLLTADAYLFSGDKEGAAKAAREALAMTTNLSSHFDRTLSKYMAAPALGWSGAEDEAMDLLEELGQPTSSLAPALITRDPIFTVPLKDNARYQALSKKLEAQMAATKLE